MRTGMGADEGPRLRRWIRLAVAPAFVWLGFALLPSGAAAILSDAGCPGPPDATALLVLGDRREAQTFTAVHTGALQRATIDIDILLPGAPAFLIQVLPTDANGVPVNGPLASANVPGASLPGGAATLDAGFSPGANVVAGHHYALAISRPGGNFLLPSWS